MTDTIETKPRSMDHRTLLWGAVGEIFAEAPKTAEEAIVTAGLDWEVELRKMGFINAKGNYVVAPKNFATVRTDTDAFLGTVKTRYVPFTNRQAFTFADNLVDGAGASFEAGWSTHGGAVVGLTMRLPDTIMVGGEDPHSQYLALRTTHDGTGSIQVATSMVRMSCTNMFAGMMSRAQNSFKVRHTSKASSQLQAARDALSISFKYAEEFEQEMEILLNTELNRDKAKAFLVDELESLRIGEKALANQVNAIFTNLDHSTTIPDDYRGTNYGLLNATSEFYQHQKTYRTDQSRYLGNTEGLGAKVVQRLERELVTV